MNHEFTELHVRFCSCRCRRRDTAVKNNKTNNRQRPTRGIIADTPRRGHNPESEFNVLVWSKSLLA